MFVTIVRSMLTRKCRLDEKTHLFKAGLDNLATLIRERYFTSVADFSNQLSIVLTRPLATPTNNTNSSDETPAETSLQTISSRLNDAKPGTTEYTALTAEQKEAKKLAKRILKAVKEPLEDATRKEAELRGRDEEEMIRKLDEMGLFASAFKEVVEDVSPVKAKVNGGGKRKAVEAVEAEEAQAVAGASPDVDGGSGDVEMEDADADADAGGIADEDVDENGKEDEVANSIPSPRKRSTPASDTAAKPTTIGKAAATEPLSPPASTSPSSSTNPVIDPSDVFAAGGIPWYLAPFDPHGTTVHEERYTGREVLRGMSEELSDMDEDTLTELHAESGDMGKEVAGKGMANGADGESKSAAKKKPKRKGRRSVWERRRR
jgi:NuA3 HAT complex component NTO1